MTHPPSRGDSSIDRPDQPPKLCILSKPGRKCKTITLKVRVVKGTRCVQNKGKLETREYPLLGRPETRGTPNSKSTTVATTTSDHRRSCLLRVRRSIVVRSDGGRRLCVTVQFDVSWGPVPRTEGRRETGTPRESLVNRDVSWRVLTRIPTVYTLKSSTRNNLIKRENPE